MLRRRLRSRNCRYCRTLFRPHPAVGNRQKSCSDPACQKARKAANNRQFVTHNPDYYRGPPAVARTRQWRIENPGYWRRRHTPLPTPELSLSALQVELAQQPIVDEAVATQQRLTALQAELVSQRLIFQGLAAQLTGCALQAELASTITRWHDKGAAINATVWSSEKPYPSFKTGEHNHEIILDIGTGSPAPSAVTIQLDRPPPDS